MRYIASLLPALLVFTLASAQDQSSSSNPKQSAVRQTASTLKTSTRLVIVDVVARSANGEMVTDLKPDDFTVFENGKKQDVRIFSFQHPVKEAAKPVIAADPSNVVTNIPRYKTTDALNVILLDGLNTAVPRQAYMRNKLVELLERLPGDQPIAVYTLGSRLQLIQDFTTDPGLLMQAVEAIHRNAASMTNNPAGGPDVRISARFVSILPAAMQQKLRGFEQESETAATESRISITLQALNSISHTLAAFPGRKNLIWISEGFPLYVDPAITVKRPTRSEKQNFGQQVSRTANTLMDSQIVIYPIDAKSLVVPYFNDVGSGDPREFGTHVTDQRTRGGGWRGYSGVDLDAMSSDFSDRLATRNTMEELADATGGKAFYNRNDIDTGIRNSIDDGSTYYTLGYYPSDKNWNGKFRKIQVKSARSGVSLRYRLGYYAINPGEAVKAGDTELKAEMNQALDLNVPVLPGLPFKAAVVPPESTGGPVAVNFGIDPHALNFERDAGGMEHASVDCVVQAYSVNGAPVKAEATRIAADLTEENFAKVNQSYLPCRQVVALAPGDYFLRLGVIDNRTGLIGTANARLTVSK